MAKNSKRGNEAARKAVAAYNAGKEVFDALGSYTGKCREDKPCQDADDL